MEKILPYLKKSGSTIIAIDAPHGLSGGKEFNIPQYAAYIILAQNSNLLPHWALDRR
jgi:hypothetical protein